MSSHPHTSLNPLVKAANFVDGQWLAQGDGTFTIVVDKYHGTPLSSVPNASTEQVDKMVASAQKAFIELRSWSAGRRSDMLRKMRELLNERKEAFAQLIVAEAGKPISYARAEVDRSLFTLETASIEAQRFTGEMVPMDFAQGTGKTAYTKRYPIGPVFGISPFNFPLNLAMHKIAPALACGCSMILKPSPLAPLSSLAFAALCEEAGYPAGSLQVFLSENDVAEKLVTDHRVKLFSFTGSPQVGWSLKSKAGNKKTVLELGGNAAVIVDETADLEKAASLVATGTFLYAGQICISTQRVFVVKKVAEEFTHLLLQATQQLGVGDPSDPDTTVGPIITQAHMNRIATWVAEAEADHAVCLLGGKTLDESRHIFAPTWLTNTKQHHKVVGQEVFGPVGVLETVPDFEMALQAANHSPFGLQAGVFTQRIDRMKLSHDTLEVGGVIMNNVPGFRMDHMPYGGVKESGLGREGVRYTMEDMTEPRLLVF